MADVEILMATRNGAAHLPDQLISIAGQSLKDWQLLVSDDGSNDRTLSVLNKFGAATGRVRLVKGPEHGAAANFLSLIARSDHDVPFVALSDQDDVWFPQKLARAVAVLKRKPAYRPAIYAAQNLVVDASGRTRSRRKTTRARNPSFANALVQNILPGHTIVMNRAAADIAKRAMPRVIPPFHDWWLYALMSGVGATIFVDPAPVVAYRQHSGSLLGAPFGPSAKMRRAGLILDGSWRAWLSAHHGALASVSGQFEPNCRQQLAALTEAHGQLPRLQALRQIEAARHGRAGTAGLHLATLTGLA